MKQEQRLPIRRMLTMSIMVDQQRDNLDGDESVPPKECSET